MTTTITKSVEIAADRETVFEAVQNVGTWPSWAVHNVKNARDLGGGGWEIQTPRGPGTVHMRGRRDLGILDHEVVDPREGSWIVPARVVEVGRVSVFMMTFARPPKMSQREFVAATDLVGEELKLLKRKLEMQRP